MERSSPHDFEKANLHNSYFESEIYRGQEGLRSTRSWNSHRGKLIFFTSVTLLSVAVSFSTLIFYQNYICPMGTSGQMCFDCVFLTKLDQQKLTSFFLDKNGKCCLKIEDKNEMVSVLQSLKSQREGSELSVESQARIVQHIQPVELPQLAKGSPIGAHKFLEKYDSQSANKKLAGKAALLHVHQKNFRGEFYNGVNLHKAGIEVIHPGHYFVYMSLFFMPDSNSPCRTFKSQTFSGLLQKRNDQHGGSDKLLNSEHTCCPSCTFDRETNFIGGVFYLNQGDILEVKVSMFDMVYIRPDSTFLGLTMMGTVGLENSKKNSTSE